MSIKHLPFQFFTVSQVVHATHRNPKKQKWQLVLVGQGSGMRGIYPCVLLPKTCILAN
jgi:hypothetical protein